MYRKVSASNIEDAFYTNLINNNIRKQDIQINYKKKRALTKGEHFSVFSRDKYSAPYLKFGILDSHVLSVRQAAKIFSMSISTTVRLLNKLQSKGLLKLTDNLIQISNTTVLNLPSSEKRQRVKYINGIPHYVLPRTVECKKLYKEVKSTVDRLSVLYGYCS